MSLFEIGGFCKGMKFAQIVSLINGATRAKFYAPVKPATNKHPAYCDSTGSGLYNYINNDYSIM